MDGCLDLQEVHRPCVITILIVNVHHKDKVISLRDVPSRRRVPENVLLFIRPVYNLDFFKVSYVRCQVIHKTTVSAAISADRDNTVTARRQH